MEEQSIKDLVSTAIEQAVNFSKAKYGDTPTDALQLTPKKYVDGVSSVLNASIIGLRSSVLGFADNLFGDGSDGSVVMTTSSVMGRDMFYRALQVSSTASLTTNGYQLFVSSVLVIDSGSFIVWNGNDGTAGSAGSVAGVGQTAGGAGGPGGAGLTAGTLPGSLGGVTGAVGAGLTASPNQNGIQSVDANTGASLSHSIGSSGKTPTLLAGAGGGADAHTGGASGAVGPAGSILSAVNLPRSIPGVFIHADLTSTFVQHTGSAQQGGAPGGGSGATGVSGVAGGGGGGGGGGSQGGIVAIYARAISNNANAGIRAQGGAGGQGGPGGNGVSGSAAGGGGGGAGGTGGTGGVIIAMYKNLSQGGTFDVTGGTSGSGGAGGALFGNGIAGSNGNSGDVGATGKIWLYQL